MARLALVLVLTIAALGQQQPVGDVFASNGSDFYATRGAVLSLRKDAADGTGAPQVGLSDGYPRSLQGWIQVQQRYPQTAAQFSSCADLLIQATNIIKQIAPLMRRPTFDHSAKQINEATRQASQLIRQADDCINKVQPGNPARPPLQGRVQNDPPYQQPQPQIPANGPGGDPNAPGGGGFVPPAGNPPAGGGRVPPSWTPAPGDPYAKVPGYIPGGYNPCFNPRRPPECPPDGTPRPPARAAKPAWDPVQYGKGIYKGLQDCGQSMMDMLSSVGFMMRGDFVGAAAKLGLKPGESVTLRTIYMEATQNQMGISPYEAGMIAGRRLCAYAIVPGLSKAGGEFVASRLPAGSRLNPIKGSAVTNNAANLQGKWIQTKTGPKQLGAKLGDGKFGSVYELPQSPGKAIKIGNSHPESPASFPRQAAGSKLLTDAVPSVPTPKIYELHAPGPENPSAIVMDNVKARWPGAVEADPYSFRPNSPEGNAIAQLHSALGNAGVLWPDGHLGNIFLTPEAGGLRAGILDSDMIFRATDLRAQPNFVQNSVTNILFTASRQGVLFNGSTARQIMDSIYSARYVDPFQ